MSKKLHGFRDRPSTIEASMTIYALKQELEAERIGRKDWAFKAAMMDATLRTLLPWVGVEWPSDPKLAQELQALKERVSREVLR